MPYVTRGVERVPGDEQPTADVLTITATNVSHVTIDVDRARVSCDVDLDVTSDGPLEAELAGCDDVAAPSTAAAPALAPAPAPLPTTGGGGVLAGLAGLLGAAAIAGRGRHRRRL